MKYNSVSKKMIVIRELEAVLIWFALSIFPFIYIDTFTIWWWSALLPLLAIYVIAALWYIPALYRSCKYLINGSVVISQKGVVFKREHMMSRQRIVCVTMIRSPLTPIFHTATVMIRATGATVVIGDLKESIAEQIVKTISPQNEV